MYYSDQLDSVPHSYLAAFSQDNRIVDHRQPLTVCISHKQQVSLITVGPLQLLNLMTSPLYFYSSKGPCDEFSALIKVSQDATSNRLVNELGFWSMGNG